MQLCQYALVTVQGVRSHHMWGNFRWAALLRLRLSNGEIFYLKSNYINVIYELTDKLLEFKQVIIPKTTKLLPIKAYPLDNIKTT